MSDANLQPRDDLLRAREELRQRAERALGQGRWRRWRPALDLTLLAAFVVLLTALLAPPVPGVLPIPALDSVAQTTIRAERDVLVEDRKATALRRQESAAGVLPVHDYDSELYFTLGDRVSAAVGKMVRRRDQSEATEVARRTAFEGDIGVPIKPGVFPLVEKLEDPLDIGIAVNFFLNMGLDRMIIANRAELPQSGGIESVDLATNRSIRLFYLGGILDLRQFRRLIQARSGDAPYGTARIVRSWIFETAMLLVGANLRANEAATRKLREDAAAEIEPVFVQIKAGEVLVRRGDRVTRSVQERMRWLNESAGGRQRWGETAAMALLLSGVILLAGIFFRRGRVAHDLDRKQILVTLTIVLIAAAFAIAMYYAGRGLAEGLAIPPETATLLIPLALATVLVSLLVDARTSLLVGIGMTILLAGESFGPSKLPELGAAAASGLIVAVLALGLLPALEHLFDQPTDMRLLELASSDHPLLKRLALVAPGSYYASVLVGNLSEAAADAIGANGLRARVMALYHDIGKIVRPGYFAENQRDHNEHDRLAPEVSARIILGHVQDGIEIAQRERLGPVGLEAITQHQGTTLTKWFYATALERARACVRTGGSGLVHHVLQELGEGRERVVGGTARAGRWHHPGAQLADHALRGLGVLGRPGDVEALQREVATQPALAVAPRAVALDDLVQGCGAQIGGENGMGTSNRTSPSQSHMHHRPGPVCLGGVSGGPGVARTPGDQGHTSQRNRGGQNLHGISLPSGRLVALIPHPHSRLI